MNYSKFDKIEDEDEFEKEKQNKKADLEQIKKEFEMKRKGLTSENGTISIEEAEEEEENSDDDSCPLFWTKPPSQRKNASKRALEMEEILTNMVYLDKTPEILLEEFKERGNQAFRQNQYKEALSCYSEALEWAHKAWTSDFDSSSKIATILSNRAAVHLKQQNYRSCINDSYASIKAAGSLSSSSSSKAKFRGSTACLKLYKPQEGLDKFLPHRIEEDSSSSSKEIQELNQLHEQLVKMKIENMEKERVKLIEMKKEKMEDYEFRTCLIKHKIKYGPLTMDIRPFTGGNENIGQIGPIPNNIETDFWGWGCLFMYPEFVQSEYVQNFVESFTFRQILSTMFPSRQQPEVESPSWDVTKSYQVDSLEIFFRERSTKPFDLTRPLFSQRINVDEFEEMDKKTRKWFRVSIDLTLNQAIHHPAYVIPGVPTFLVLSKNSPKYYQLFTQSCIDNDGPIVDVKN